MTELREAIGILSSGDSKSLRARSVPWRQSIEKLFCPLIETQTDPENPKDCFCILFHSTVKAFLQDNADIFCHGHDDSSSGIYLISEVALGNACLKYLTQSKYAQALLRIGGHWVTDSGENVRDHHFLTYSAKYWDRHLDEVEDCAPLRQEVKDFLTSSNVVTMLQIQGLFVEGRFNIYTVDGCSSHHKYTKRVFPKWLASESRFAKDYRNFTADWFTLLHSGTCRGECCRSIDYQGELNRCLWKALGNENFLSFNEGRYNDFILASEESSRIDNEAPYFEGVMTDGSEVMVLVSQNTE